MLGLPDDQELLWRWYRQRFLVPIPSGDDIGETHPLSLNAEVN
jgi:hypothetical protein